MPPMKSANHEYCEDTIKNYLNVMENLSHSMDGYLYLSDLRNDKNWFFGNVGKNYTLHDNGRVTNTFAEILNNVYPDDREVLRSDLKKLISGEKSVHDMEYRWLNRLGHPVWVSCKGTVVKDEEGKPFIMIGRVSEEALRHLHNPLTGLFNKTKMMSDLKNDFVNAGGGYFMLMDIDDLAAINLSRGREYGDSVLKALANILENSQPVKKVYHVDHNYFAMCLNLHTEQQVHELFEHIQSGLEDKCTVTAGVVPMDNNVFIDENNMYDSAKITLRKAKSRGNNMLAFFSAEEVAQRVEAIELLEEMHESVKNNFEGFYLVYQPQIRAGGYSLFAAEALLRYTSKKRGNIFPDEFIPLLEQSGLINQVGLWVLETALIQCKKWRRHIPDVRISVNFSAAQLDDGNIVDNVISVLDKTGMTGDTLTIEITESVQLRAIRHFGNIIAHLKESGIQIAIDDFGTGYSNIGYLKELDVDEIKIDKSFVQGIREDTYNYNLIKNTIEFAKTNDLRVCCEGVEEERELIILEALSPDLMQGYLFDKPCEPAHIEASYMDENSDLYRKREGFVRELYRLKEKMGVVRFDPMDILRETNMGLWIIRINQASQVYEMLADETMERIMAVDKKYTPRECYDFWYSRIKPEYVDYVHQNVQLMMDIDKVVQLEYPWIHPTQGEVVVRCNGRRTKDSDGMIVLEGYHRILSNIEGA
ncbi:MAG: EAL domain-containing protein [Clostridia bacterium]|nr:EAL domain-containing protein [Clostridia bacterium]